MKYRILALILLLTMLCIPADSMNEYTIIYDGEEIISDQPPIISDYTLLVPLRCIAEKLGAEVSWINNEGKAVVDYNRRTIKVKPNDDRAITDNGDVIEMEMTKLINGRLLVPINFLVESLCVFVEFDVEDTSKIIIKKIDFDIPFNYNMSLMTTISDIGYRRITTAVAVSNDTFIAVGSADWITKARSLSDNAGLYLNSDIQFMGMRYVDDDELGVGVYKTKEPRLNAPEFETEVTESEDVVIVYNNNHVITAKTGKVTENSVEIRADYNPRYRFGVAYNNKGKCIGIVKRHDIIPYKKIISILDDSDQAPLDCTFDDIDNENSYAKKLKYEFNNEHFIAEDFGEFGGVAAHIADDKKEYVVLSDYPIGMFFANDKIYLLSGLYHGGIYLLDNINGRWQPTEHFNLNGEPKSYYVEDNILYVTVAVENDDEEIETNLKINFINGGEISVENLL